MKKFFATATTVITVLFATAIRSFAATVELPPELSEITPILEFVLKIVEFLAKIAHFLTGATR